MGKALPRGWEKGGSVPSRNTVSLLAERREAISIFCFPERSPGRVCRERAAVAYIRLDDNPCICCIPELDE